LIGASMSRKPLDRIIIIVGAAGLMAARELRARLRVSKRRSPHRSPGFGERLSLHSLYAQDSS
jgi:hypothetical protein